MSSLDDHAAVDTLVHLAADWGVLRVGGADAATFLQGQLTNDVASLDAGRAALAGYCSAKGRLLATFVVWRPFDQAQDKPANDEFLLACSADVLAATVKRLSMFVLRAKCKVTDAGFAPVGAIGDGVPEHVRAAPAMQMIDGWLRLPDVDGTARAWRVAPSADGDGAADVPGARASDLWRWLEVRSGWPRISAAAADAFVPQMVNLELVGGVSFGKGCYPGQEVVARSQYRGTLKRRMHLFAGTAPSKPGDEVFHDADPSQPSGTVVDAASSGDAHAVLVSLKTALLDSPGDWRLRSADGPVIAWQPMPYDVPREAAAV
jgi:tRNA-modifying protein YgfZ